MNVKKIVKRIQQYYLGRDGYEFRKNIRLSKGLPITFINWWGESYKDDWFNRYITNRFKITSDTVPLIYFISVFGNRRYLSTDILNKIKKDRLPTVFYTGENLYSDVVVDRADYQDHCLDYVDLALGFNDIKHENYLRFPHWFFGLINPTKIDKQSIEDKLAKLQHKRLMPKLKFCSLVSRHDTGGIRLELFNLLNSIDGIDSGGKFLKNTNALIDIYKNNKISFLEQYMFNICPENSDTNLYVTEKIFDAIGAGTLPVYWGSNGNPEPNVLNKEAFLLYDQNKPETLYNEVKSLYLNKQQYNDFMQQNIFLPTATEYICDTLNSFDSKIAGLINNRYK